MFLGSSVTVLQLKTMPAWMMVMRTTMMKMMVARSFEIGNILHHWASLRVRDRRVNIRLQATHVAGIAALVPGHTSIPYVFLGAGPE